MSKAKPELGGHGEGERGLFARLGRLVAHHPWRVIGVWVIAAVAVIGLAPHLTSTTDEASFLPSHYESVQAQNLQESAFPQAASPAAIIVLERADGTALSAADSAAVQQIGSKLEAAHIADVTTLQVGEPSANKLIQTIGVQMPTESDPQDTHQTDAVKTLRTQLQSDLSGTGLKGGITGTAAQTLDSQSSGNKADAIIGIATIGLILVLLLIIFRSPIIAFLPIITIGIVSQVADGLIAWASNAFNLKTDSSVTSMLIVVLFGVGTDYILFFMFRYRERLRAGDDPRQAVVAAVTRAGEAIASAGGAVIVSFLALTLSTLGLFRSLGPALAIAVAVTLLAGLTLIPAVVALLGTRVFWPSKAWRNEPRGARFAAIGRSMGRRPARFAAVSGLIMVALAIAAFSFHPSFDLSAGSTSSTAESTVWQNQLLRGEPAGATTPTEIFLKSTDGAKLDASQLSTYRSELAAVPGVGTVSEAIPNSTDTVAVYQVALAHDPSSSAAIDTVKGPLRTTAHQDAPRGTTALVGGITAIYADIEAAVNHDYAVVFPVAAIIIMLILALVLRAVVAPLYLMASVGLGFGATLGATVLLFQHSSSSNGLIFMLPVIMYMFVVALGTDYNILMITRLREEARAGKSPRQAAAEAVRHAGPTIGAAGIILAGSFASLMLAGQSTLSQMGFAISAGIAIAAFVMSMFFTPAITALLGHAAWWPGHADAVRDAAPDSTGEQSADFRPGVDEIERVR
ncbi:MMPL family transporter [Actinospica robiniae]|uniref:MMPL family transporter n=1 Tax=Actinospica robiniae TaxID=304901 RepID=UPI000428611F|nr:MMPL family transporter [Actinospica robiniae]